MQTIDDLISVEVMGDWPIYKMNLREILIELGFVDDGTYLKLHVNDPKLDLYPQRLKDDGMGYGGGSEEWIHEVDVDNESIHLWTEKELPKTKLDELKANMVEMDKIIKQKITEAKKILDEDSR